MACSYYMEKKFRNSLKWFEIAIQLNPFNSDSYYGKTIACLKLGLNTEALESLHTLQQLQRENPVQAKPSEFYNEGQFTLLNAICNRILKQHTQAA